jgi:hypothetical protein
MLSSICERVHQYYALFVIIFDLKYYSLAVFRESARRSLRVQIISINCRPVLRSSPATRKKCNIYRGRAARY